jgi:hypothetical protein
MARPAVVFVQTPALQRGCVIFYCLYYFFYIFTTIDCAICNFFTGFLRIFISEF